MAENGRWTCKCGRELDELDNYCNVCGEKRPEPDSPMTDDERLACALGNCWFGSELPWIEWRSDAQNAWMKIAVLARSLLCGPAEAKGRREAYSEMANEMASWAALCEQKRDSYGPAKADAEGFPTDHMPVIPEHAKMTAFHGQGDPAPTSPVATELEKVQRWQPLITKPGMFRHCEGAWVRRCDALEASSRDQADAVKAATEALRVEVEQLKLQKSTQAEEWQTLQAERDDLRAKLEESERESLERLRTLANVEHALVVEMETDEVYPMSETICRILREKKAEIESLRGDCKRIARIRNEDAQWFARLSNFLSSDAMKDHHHGFRGHCVEDAIEVIQRMTGERDEALRASYEHGQTVARFAMAADGLRANLDSLPRYRPVSDGLGRPSMTKHAGPWDAENPGWLNVDAVYALLAPKASPEQTPKDDGAGDIIAYVTPPVAKDGSK